MKVPLIKPHKHEGVLHPIGAEIEVRGDQAERLRRHGKIEGNGNKPKLASVDSKKKGD